MKRNRGLLALIIILVIIFIDQATKLYVKTHFYLGESVDVTSWFKILFIENNGMAFGMEIGSTILGLKMPYTAGDVIFSERKMLSRRCLESLISYNVVK